MLRPFIVDDRYSLAEGRRSNDDILIPPAGASSFQRGFVGHGIKLISTESHAHSTARKETVGV